MQIDFVDGQFLLDGLPISAEEALESFRGIQYAFTWPAIRAVFIKAQEDWE